MDYRAAIDQPSP